MILTSLYFTAQGPINTMSDARAQNMEKRRVRILAEARKMLAKGGCDALKLRDLAEASDITVPTIYNLIGNKTDILKTLVMGSFAEYEASMEKKLPCPAEQLPALMIDTLMDIISRDEDYFRATALASEHIENESDELDNYGFRRAPLIKYAGQLCHDAKAEGLLRGDIGSEQLILQMTCTHHIAFQDWAHHAISLAEFKNQFLSGIYVALAADAVDDFRNRLAAKLENF